jgi:phospholipid-binding lipoprotein MlaA
VDGSYLVAVMDSNGINEGVPSMGHARPLSFGQKDSSEEEEDEEEFDDIPEGEMEGDFIRDPLEPINRVFFHFNDKLYFWILKPVATGYEKVTPDQFRICVRNFFSNLTMPIRAVNCLLQGKFVGFGTELLRFVVNSTAGMLGLMDPAQTALKLEKQDEDFGQTLGVYGLGPGFFINWPFLGPSSVRGTIGFAGNYYLDPVAWVSIDFGEWVVIRAGELVNTTALSLGEYEALKKAALDPYVAMRDAYYQYRQNKIKN